MTFQKQQIPSPSDIAAQAIKSRDGILISELLKQIAFSKAPQDERSDALQRVAAHHNEMPHVVIGALSMLSMIDAVAAKRVAHAALSGRPDHERDMVYAAAARSLIELQPVSSADLTVIARCVCSPYNAVKNEIARTIDNLPHFVAATLADNARSAEQTPTMKQLVSILDQRIALRRATLPAFPTEPRSIEDELPVVEQILTRPKMPRAVKSTPPPAVTKQMISAPPKPKSTPAPTQKAPPAQPEEISRPRGELSTVMAKPSSLQLTAEQSSFIAGLRRHDVSDLSETHLVNATLQETDPLKLLSLLCELTLRQGKQVRDEFMSRIVWLTSTPFSAGNEDVRRLIKILFAEECGQSVE